MSRRDRRRQEALAAIPQDWITSDEAIRHIMAVEQCSKEEAEAIYDEFVAACPGSVKMVSLQ